jgi:hypothetical protein
MGGASSFDGTYGGARYLSADDNAGSLPDLVITANYHNWAWGGWASQESGSFGAPAGHYQFQVPVNQEYIFDNIEFTRF